MKTIFKLIIADAICHPIVGGLISVIYRGRIRHGGGIIDTNNKHIGRRNAALLYWGLYERAEINYIDKYLSTGLDVIELGSSMGVVSLHIVQKQQQGKRLICVEANPYLIDTIKSNLRTNAPRAAVEVLNRVISYGNAGETNFSVCSDTLVSSVTGPSDDTMISIKSCTLGELLGEFGIKDYALVSDVEGAEAGFILQDGEALSGCREMIIELHSTDFKDKKYSAEDFREMLETTHGFKLITKCGAVYAFRR